MTVAIVLRFFVIVGLGVLAVVTFLVAGTIIGLMIFDDARCGHCDSYPVGLWALGALGLLFAYSMVHVAIEQLPMKVSAWYPQNKETLVLMGIILIAFILIFLR